LAKQTVPNSGLWSSIAALINANFTEVYDKVQHGVYDYNDTATQTTPISIAAPATFYSLTNNALGAFTNTTYALPSVPNVWFTGTQDFRWTGLELGDTVDIRLDIEVTSTSVNQDFDLVLFIADGQPGVYQIPFTVERAFKSAGARRVILFSSIYMGDTNTLNNVARFKIKSSGTGSVKVNGWFVRVQKRVA
jgi:hypothetical protein